MLKQELTKLKIGSMLCILVSFICKVQCATPITSCTEFYRIPYQSSQDITIYEDNAAAIREFYIQPNNEAIIWDSNDNFLWNFEKNIISTYTLQGKVVCNLYSEFNTKQCTELCNNFSKQFLRWHELCFMQTNEQDTLHWHYQLKNSVVVGGYIRNPTIVKAINYSKYIFNVRNGYLVYIGYLNEEEPITCNIHNLETSKLLAQTNLPWKEKSNYARISPAALYCNDRFIKLVIKKETTSENGQVLCYQIPIENPSFKLIWSFFFNSSQDPLITVAQNTGTVFFFLHTGTIYKIEEHHTFSAIAIATIKPLLSTPRDYITRFNVDPQGNNIGLVLYSNKFASVLIITPVKSKHCKIKMLKHYLLAQYYYNEVINNNNKKSPQALVQDNFSPTIQATTVDPPPTIISYQKVPYTLKRAYWSAFLGTCTLGISSILTTYTPLFPLFFAGMYITSVLKMRLNSERMN